MASQDVTAAEFDKLDGVTSTTAELNLLDVSTASGASSSTFLRGDGSWQEAGGGITEYDQWRVTSNLITSGGTGDVTANWERNDTDFDKIGTGMTESSGIFTFPSTGIWHVENSCYVGGGSASLYNGMYIYVSSDSGSSYSIRATAFETNHGSGYHSAISSCCGVDVTNTSTFRIKLGWQVTGSAQFNCDSTAQRFGLTFIRIGDT